MSTTYDIQITSHSSHVRSTPEYKSNGSNVIGYVFNGDKFTATKVQNGWYYVPSKKGWIKDKSSSGAVYVKVLKVNKVSKPENNTATAKKKEVEKETKPEPPKPTKTVASTSMEYMFLTQALSKVNTLDYSGVASENMIELEKSEAGRPTNSTENIIFKDIPTGNRYSTGEGYIKGMSGSVKLSSLRDLSLAKPSNYSDIEGALEAIRKNMNIFGIEDRDRLYTEFNRYKIAMPDYHATKLIPYIFFTKPELGMVTSRGDLIRELDGDPLWESLYGDNPQLFTGLDSEYGRVKHSFNAFLSNTAMSFQASDEVLKTVEHGETYTGWKMVYGRNTNESNTAGQFSISYIDNYNFDIYKMHKIWVEYINRVYRGEMAVKRDYIFKKILTYPCSLYYIVCAADGETILYWTKYFGVFPINTPASVSSWTHGNHHGLPEFSINYMYAIKEDFHPISLSEFNRQSEGSRIYRKIYDRELVTNSRSLVGAPFIEAHREDGRVVYKLRFRDS